MKSTAIQKAGLLPMIVPAAVCLLLAGLAAAGFAAEEARAPTRCRHRKADEGFWLERARLCRTPRPRLWALKKANVKRSLADRQAAIDKALNEAAEAKAAAENNSQNTAPSWRRPIKRSMRFTLPSGPRVKRKKSASSPRPGSPLKRSVQQAAQTANRKC